MSALPEGRAGLTEGRWAIARAPGAPDRYGQTLVVDERGRAVADCANRELPIEEQRANARAVAALPLLVDVLVACEEWIGDLPRRPDGADEMYTRVLAALRRLSIPPHAVGGRR